MSIEDLRIVYEAANTNESFDWFLWLVGDETDIQTILSWFKDSTVH